MYIFKNIYLYWIYAANNLGNICQLNICVGTVMVLGDKCKFVVKNQEKL